MTAFEIDFVVKLGGSAITKKDVLETLDPDALGSAADVLAECFGRGLRFIVAHGAGSFGHQLAKHYDVSSGYKSKKTAEEQMKVKVGLAITRQSVHKLNRHVVESLVGRGIPALGISACPSWWKDGGFVVKDGCADLEKLVAEGFVPVIHGDSTIDCGTGCCILSSDTILEVLCAKLSIKRAVFVMDCSGICTCPPDQPESTVIPVVYVNEDGSISDSGSPRTRTADTDATGGIVLKLKSAISIVRASRGRVGLFLCSLSGNALMDACVHGQWRGDSVGTIVSMRQ